MKHILKKSGVLITLLLTAFNLSAYDLEVDGIYYNVTSFENFEVKVTSGTTKYSVAITIPETIKYNGKTLTVVGIEDGAFAKCTSLYSLVIKDSSKSFDIPFSCFEDSPLKYIYIGRNPSTNYLYCKTTLQTAEIGDFVTKINGSMFDGCTNLKSVTLGNGVTSIGDFAFFGCNSLISIEIPNSVETIGQSAFYSCTGLKSVKIGTGVTNISNYAFYKCTALISIYCEKEIPCIINTSTFITSHYINATLYIPVGSLTAYQSADYWKNFWNIVESEELGGVSTSTIHDTKIYTIDGVIIIENATDAISVYDLNGTLINSQSPNSDKVEISLPKRGLYIVHTGNKATKIIF